MRPPVDGSNFGLPERAQFWGGVVRVTIRLHNFVHSSFVGIRKFETVTISKHKSTADSGNAYPAGTHSIRTPVLLSVSASPCVFLLSMV